MKRIREAMKLQLENFQTGGLPPPRATAVAESVEVAVQSVESHDSPERAKRGLFFEGEVGQRPAMETGRELMSLMLREPRLKLAVAESMTAGHLQTRIAAVTGASNFFVGGITAYTLDQKVKHLGVNRRAAELVNCVSATVAEQMAVGGCELFGADVALATTGYAEPSVEWAVNEPFAWWAAARRKSSKEGFSLRSGRIACEGAKRVEAQAEVADAALAALVAWLRQVRK